MSLIKASITRKNGLFIGPLSALLVSSFLFRSAVLGSETNRKPENPSSQSTSSKIFYGKINELDANSSLNKFAPFGFVCTQEGANELPVKVTEVALNGLAYEQGLKVNDRILQILAKKNSIELAIERDGKPYSITLPLVSLNSNLKAEIAKSSISLNATDNAERSKLLYGKVNDLELRPALSQYAKFGFLSAREGVNELPAKVTDVTLNSMAYWQGLKVNDKILEAQVAKRVIRLSVERDGKPYVITISTEHPFAATEIARSALNGVIQKNYADCWFDAALGAVALSPAGQNLIAGLITQGSPKSYYVTFLDQPTICWPVTIQTMQHYELQDKALWASILEQACLLRFSTEHQKGGRTEDAMAMLTGKKIGTAMPENIDQRIKSYQRLSMSQMADIINRALLNHEPVAIATKSPFVLLAEDRQAALKQAGVALNPNGTLADPNIDRDALLRLEYHVRSAPRTPLILWAQHAYTVIAFDPASNIITMRNPFGTEDQPEPDGTQKNAPWAGRVDAQTRSQYIQDLGQGVIKIKFDILYRYLSKLVWTTL